MSIIIGTQTITRNPSLGTVWNVRRINQSTVQLADGSWVTYDNGANILMGTIQLKNVSGAQAESFRTWLISTAVFEKNSFTITPPANTDLGSGDGVAITTAFYDGGPTTDGVLFFAGNSNTYDITFPFKKVL